jgi:hypothetical protein
MPSSSSKSWICVGSTNVAPELLAPLNSNIFSIFSKTLLHMILTYKCLELWNV